MGGIQQKFIYISLRQELHHRVPVIKEAEGIMPGSGAEEREDGKVVFRVRGGEHIQVIAEVEPPPVGIPSDVTVGLAVDTVTFTFPSDDDNLSPKVHPPKEKPQKPKKKGEKAPPVEKYTVKELFEKFEREPPQDMKPCLRLFQIFKELFLLKSDRDGLIDLMHLSSLWARGCHHRKARVGTGNRKKCRFPGYRR